ncbi:hypothetical protein [Enterobacter sp. HNGD-822]
MSVNRYDVMSYILDVDGNSGPFVKYEDYDALEARCAALAAKGMEVVREASLIYSKYNDTQMPDRDIVDQQTLQELYEICTADGDSAAFLAEVRAHGVEMFAAHKRERQQALRSRSMRMSEEAAGMAADAENFADELRKGVQS